MFQAMNRGWILVGWLCVAVFAAPPGSDRVVYPYAGSVEHVGMTNNPGPFFYDGKSLAKNFIVKDHAAELSTPLTNYAEPIVNYIMVGRTTQRTDKKRAPVQVLEMKPGSKSIKWKVGPLPVGTYMFRIIGAIPTSDVVVPAKQQVWEFCVNDQLDGRVSSYVLRGRGVDSFYCLQEFGFHVTDNRSIEIELKLHADSQTMVYLHNIEIHDLLAGCANEGAKNTTSLYTLDQREQARKIFAQSVEGKKMLTEIENAGKNKLSVKDRQQRDRDMWNAIPPINRVVNEFCFPHFAPEHVIALDDLKKGEADKTWLLNRTYGGQYGSGWDQPFSIIQDSFNTVRRHPFSESELYTLYNYAAHDPLGDSGDRGWGVMTNRTEKNMPVLVFPFVRINQVALYSVAKQFEPENLNRYYLGNDENYARDAALMLCRMAWDMPTISMKHSVQSLLVRGDTPWEYFNLHGSKLVNHQFGEAYDRLFPFIQNNTELAEAVGKFIPWVKSPKDVIKLLDSHLLQYMAKNMQFYRYFNDENSGEWLLSLASVQANAKITEPWMQFLWTRPYYYPLGHQPLPDVLAINTQRDGSSSIGSSFYTYTGGPSTWVARAIEPYIRTGGDAKYDLRDFTRFPGAVAGCYFAIESNVAGQYTIGVGDVGGPSVEYGRQTDPVINADIGWRWTHDPSFAWLLVNRKGRTDETDAQWKEITDAAQNAANPIMSKRSRVLPDWSGILESGVSDPDFRFHRAVAVRTGRGWGHQHNDSLDLRIWAHGLIMTGDMGQRGGYGKPNHSDTMVHNVVQIDHEDVNAHAWIKNIADFGGKNATGAGVQYLQAEATAPKNGLLRRQVAMIDVDAGTPASGNEPQKNAKVVTPNSYVFDVFRAAGGKMLTYSFHGCVDDMNFEDNTRNKKLLPRDQSPERIALEKSDSEAEYLKDFRWSRPDYMGKDFNPAGADWTADAPDGADAVLQATWRLAREAEKRMVGGVSPQTGLGGAMTEPRKFTRLHLFSPQGMRVLQGIVIDKMDAARINPEFPHYAGRCLFVQKHAVNDQPLQNAFAAVIEPFAGQPFIASRRELKIASNENDALRAVAVEIKTVNGRTDICMADGRPEKRRTISEADMEFTGEFACVTRDEKGLVSAAITGGNLLKTGQISIVPQLAVYRSKVGKIDYASRTLTLDQAIAPSVLRGAFVEIGDEQRRVTHEIDQATQTGSTTSVHLRKGIMLMSTTVKGLRPNKDGGTIVETQIGGLGIETGAWVTNANYSKFWRQNSSEASQGIITGFATMNDFGDEARVYVLEVGPAMELVLPTRVSLSRVKLTDGDAFEVCANVPFSINGAAALTMSRDGKTWEKVSGPLNADEKPLYLRGI